MLHAVGVCDQDSRFELQNRQGHRATNAFRRRGLAARRAPPPTMRPRRLWAPAGSQSLRVHANLARPFGAPAATDGGSKGGEAER